MQDTVAPGGHALQRGRRVKRMIAIGLAVLTAVVWAATAHAGTDQWCNPCSVAGGTGKPSGYRHHFTYVETYDLTDYYYVGAGVLSCYSIAHGYGDAHHTYGTPCLSYGWGENTYASSPTRPLAIWGNF